jgi:ATP-dependent helicase HepA
MDLTATLACSVSATSSTVTPGRYPFAIYRWKILGLTESFAFQPICESEQHACGLLELLEHAIPDHDTPTLTSDEEERLEAVHYRKWIGGRGEHIEAVTQSAAVKLASLTASHEARVALLEEQREQATDGRIRRMKEGQIDAANRDCDRRRAALQDVAAKAEIVTEAAVLGVLLVKK